MTEQQINDQGIKAEVASNVVSLLDARERRNQPPVTDDELAEYRRILPVLLKIIEQWPQILKEHQAITSNCMLAKKILAADP